MAKRIGVLIGRFQGYHHDHHTHLRRAALANDILIVIVGSRNKRCSPKNPWSVEERISMIEENIKADEELNSCRIVFRSTNDHPDDNVWAHNVSIIVNDFGHADVTLYGTKKDESSFYLDLFPQWNTDLIEVQSDFSATKLRELWLGNQQWASPRMRLEPMIPFATTLWLDKQEFNRELQKEYDWYQAETERFAEYPFPETLTFCCGDAVVVCHGQVLMVRRKFLPGKDCLALPGGFKNRNETFHQAAVRELYEETGLVMPERHLMTCKVGEQLFDKPSRSIGIPRATLAVAFDVSKFYMDCELPLTQAADDAAEVVWVPIKDLTHLRNVFDDHAAIVLTMFK